MDLPMDKRKVTADEAKRIGTALGINWAKTERRESVAVGAFPQQRMTGQGLKPWSSSEAP